MLSYINNFAFSLDLYHLQLTCTMYAVSVHVLIVLQLFGSNKYWRWTLCTGGYIIYDYRKSLVDKKEIFYRPIFLCFILQNNTKIIKNKKKVFKQIRLLYKQIMRHSKHRLIHRNVSDSAIILLMDFWHNCTNLKCSFFLSHLHKQKWTKLKSLKSSSGCSV